MLDLNDRAVVGRLDDLQKLGLSRPEAVVYAVLNSLGPCHARRLGGPTRYRREEIYPILRSLQSKGLVEARLGRPTTFAAIDPGDAVSIFESRMQDEITERKMKAEELGRWLREIRGALVEDETVDLNVHIRLLQGRQVLKDSIRLIQGCKTDCMLVTTPRRLARYDEFGILDALLSASKRGVKVRIIVQSDALVTQFEKKYRRRFEIRHIQGLYETVVILLSDDSGVGFVLSGPDEIRGTFAIHCDSHPLANGFRPIFESLWTAALPVTQVSDAR